MADSLTYNNIIVGKSIPIKYRAGTVTGENFVAGTVLGKITASGKLKKLIQLHQMVLKKSMVSY